PVYETFLVMWLAFNRAYNDLEEGRDYEKVLAVGQRLQQRWDEVSGLASLLVSLECIGGEPVGDSRLLQPNEWVKGATLYLREQLDLQSAIDPQTCEFGACRPEKRRLCDRVEPKAWDKGEMAALLRLVYQVRCNLIHGDKRLADQDVQTNRDQQLICISRETLDRVLGFLLEEE
ncbi:MAG: hypothetical protein ACE5F6_16900, partial [Anaerolineae bacterium]